MWCLLRGPLLVFIVVLATDTKLKLEWCDLYGRVDDEGNHTTVVFQKLRSQFDKDLYRDLSCLLKSASFVLLPTSDILPKAGAPCYDIINFLKSNPRKSSSIAVLFLGGPLCDIQKTSTMLKGLQNIDRVSYWRINTCINCTFSTTQYDTAEGNPVHLVTMPAIFMSHLIPSMDSVHALANKLTGTPTDGRLPGLYVPITLPNDSLTSQFTPWEKGGHIAALVSLIFMFFVMALFVCCCAFTQSALIIEDYNHRDEMQLIWRLQEDAENERLNGPHLQGDPDNLSMHSEATQASVEAESEQALL